MKIYFDNVLINNNYCAELVKNSVVYNNVFKVGSTICETFRLKVDKQLGIPELVEFKDENDNLLKTLYVSDFNDEDDFTISLDLEDAMTKFNFKYDASPIMTHIKIVDDKVIHFAYLSEILDDICSKAGITTNIATFYGDTKEISWYDVDYTGRNYLSFIAELNGKNLKIDNNNELVFVDINTTPTKTITFDEISKYKLGIEHKITRVVFDNGVNPNPWSYGDTTGETYYIDASNVYINESADVEHLYNEIKDFTYYNFKTSNCPLDGLEVGDLVEFNDGTNSYITFTQFHNSIYSGNKWFGGIEVNLEGEVKQETQIEGQDDKYRRIKQIVDLDNTQLETLVEDVDSLNRIVQDDMYTKNEIQRIVDGRGVDGVKVTKVETISGTFDIDGMHYEKSFAFTKSTINESGVEVLTTDLEEEVLFAGYDSEERKMVVRTDNLNDKKYLRIGLQSRLQDYKNGGGVFIA